MRFVFEQALIGSLECLQKILEHICADAVGLAVAVDDTFQDVTKGTDIDKTEYRYHRGLITWQLNYDYMDGRWRLKDVYRYKYDFRHKLPLERTFHCENYQYLPNNLLIFIAMMTDRVGRRLVWTYEKAK